MLRSRIGIVLLLSIGGGCKSVRTPPPNELATSSRDLILGLDEVGYDFDFCADKRSFSLTNALWLNYLAANQYAHFKEIGPMLEKLGFGEKGEGQSYIRSWYELRIKRIQEKRVETDDTWTSEDERLIRLELVKAEYAKTFGAPYADDKISATEFEDKIVGGKGVNEKIRFVSGFNSGKTAVREKASTQAFYAEHGTKDFSVISFRGTETDEDADKAVNNETAQENMALFGGVHVGFYRGMKQVDEKLIQILEARSAQKPIKLWITGHSLGAALATLMTARLIQLKEAGQLRQVTLMGMYNIGSPRVGNGEFAAQFDALTQKYQMNVVRFKNHKDLVTGIPFGQPFKPDYWHVGSLAYFDGEGKFFYGDGWEDIERASNVAKLGFPTSISDHSSAQYFVLTKRAYEEKLNTPLTDCTLRAGDRPLNPYRENTKSRK